MFCQTSLKLRFIKVDKGPLQDKIAIYGHFKRYIYCYSKHKHGNLY